MINILLTFLAVFCITIGLFAFIAKLKVYQETHKNQPFIFEVLLVSIGVTMLLLI